MIRLMHVHQAALGTNGEVTNHRPIDNILGPHINFLGMLALIADELPQRPPLLVEVRNIDEAVRSCKTLLSV